MSLYFKNILEELLSEKWTNKYKKSINCKNPKGFSQKAHCTARKKRKKGLKSKSKSPFNESVLLESSKYQILIDKLGLTPENAAKMDKKTGKLSIWLTNKIKDLVVNNLGSFIEEKHLSKEYITKNLNEVVSRNIFVERSLTSIMDYIRVGLNGNISTIKDLSYNELYRKSVDWHESLQVGQGDINYNEENTIIKDFRDENGMGFYWVDLETNNSPEECERMGHCGRTAGGNTILSLREFKPIPNSKYVLNKSHLTAAVGDDGILYQLKGSKNSKPKAEFHQYILPLFYVLGGAGEEDDYLIQGFGSEYASEMDFKLTDLPDSVIKDLYTNRPEFFQSRSLKRKLSDMGIIDIEPINMVFQVEIPSHRVSEYIDGDYVIRTYKKTTPAGNTTTEKIYLFENILQGDVWDLWENYNADWKSALDYDVDSENEKKIEELLKKMAEESGVEFDEELSIKEQIEEYDENSDIVSAIVSSVIDAESSQFANDLREHLKELIEEYGTILKMDDEGVTLEIDLSNFLEVLDEDNYDNLFEECNDEPSCVFEQLIYNGDIDKPDWSFDDRYYPDINESEFNYILSDRLAEI